MACVFFICDPGKQEVLVDWGGCVCVCGGGCRVGAEMLKAQTDPWEFQKPRQGGHKSWAQIESPKRSVSYSQPNICSSQGRSKSDRAASWLCWLLCSRHFKSFPQVPSALSCFSLGQLGEAGRVGVAAMVRMLGSLFPSTIWGPYLNTHSLGVRKTTGGGGRG